jgi:hypothetical protein
VALHRMMSFGVSRQSSERIGRYGNGFKSSSMRLGADALVLSVSRATGGMVAGLLSFTFLKSTGAADVVVPIVEWTAEGKAPRGPPDALARRREALSTILEWGPEGTEAALLAELRKLGSGGTTVLISNLWEAESGGPELDLFSDVRILIPNPGPYPHPDLQPVGRGEWRARARPLLRCEGPHPSPWPIPSP